MNEIKRLSSQIEVLIKRHIFDTSDFFEQKFLTDLFVASSNYNLFMEKKK